MHRNVIETALGAVVLAVALLFFIFAYNNSQVRIGGGYEVQATFGRVDGLAIGDEVRLGGMKVGAVSNLQLDPDGYAATVTMRLDSDLKLPVDSDVAIHTLGLLGGKYLELQPGGDEQNLEPGGAIAYSQDSVILEELLEKIVSVARDAQKEKNEGAAPEDSSNPFGGSLEN